MTIKAKLAGLAFAGAVMAAPATAGAVTIVQTFSGAPGAVQGFSDSYVFNAPFAGKLTVKLESTNVGGGTNVNFNASQVKLNGITLNVVSRGVYELRRLINLPVSSGPQTLSVVGASQAFGTYTGSFTLATVPEPATWAFMILGFGAVGMFMRRRKANVSVSYA